MHHRLACRVTRLLPLIALLGSIGGALALGSPAAPLRAQEAPALTEIRLFLPWIFRALTPQVVVTDQVTGTCPAGSLSNSRPDAWRCQDTNRGYDPCFRGFQADQLMLACPESPWSPNVVLLAPTTEVPADQTNRENFTTALPWALELADGSHCVRLGGTQLVYAGLRTNYSCEGGSVTGMLGVPDRSQTHWRVFALSAENPLIARQIGVDVAWW